MTRFVATSDIDDLVARLVEDPTLIDTLDHPLADDLAGPLVLALKGEADRHWDIDPHQSLEIAATIRAIGEMRGDLAQVALGMMACGNARMKLGDYPAAWKTFEEAGARYLEAGDEVGWARTRIGRLGICVEMKNVPLAMREADRAETIFRRAGEEDMRLRLMINRALTHNEVGEHHQAVELFERARALALRLGGTSHGFIGNIDHNLGYSHVHLGNVADAYTSFERVIEFYMERGATDAVILGEHNLAYIEVDQADYRGALARLHRVNERASPDNAKLRYGAQRLLIRCYLGLGRHGTARRLLDDALPEVRDRGMTTDEAWLLLYKGRLEVESGRLDEARRALSRANDLYRAIGSEVWSAHVQLELARHALTIGDPAQVLANAFSAHEIFQTQGRRWDRAATQRLIARAYLLQGELDLALAAADPLLGEAMALHDPELRYDAHMIHGELALRSERRTRARRHFRAAAATVERLLRGLTITMRADALGGRGDALRRLISMDLEDGHGERAFAALEQSKSQLWLSHMLDRQQLRWPSDRRSRALLDQLERLRKRHYWLTNRTAQPQSDGPAAPRPDDLLSQIADNERRIRQITEQLYLMADGGNGPLPRAPSLAEIAARLEPGWVLVEYYRDAENLWAFTLDPSGALNYRLLTDAASEIDTLQARLGANIRRALRAGPGSPASTGLSHLFARDAVRLHELLVAPIRDRIDDAVGLTIVPYGALHYLPFHLLHDGEGYVIDRHEIVMLPAAGLVTHEAPRRAGGARILTHSHSGALPHTGKEGDAVHTLLGGDIYHEERATRRVLGSDPVSVLHLAAHGEFRIDQPEFSSIILADGELFADDLVQHDLSYELVTLSACDTGRAHVAPGDELVGLGRAILYAGAGALIASLWRVSDEHTAELMTHLYEDLATGATKSSALQAAQRRLRRRDPTLHPAFWGAFELVGDGRPLRQIREPQARR